MRLNTTQAEQKLKRIARAFDALNRAMGKQSNALKSVNNALRQSENKTTKAKKATDRWANSLLQTRNNAKSTNSALKTVLSTVKKIAGAYVGIETVKLGIQTSDKLTRAENRLNNLEGATPETTAETMDKVYAAAQRARTGYTGMLSNVSKTMILAGESFQGNIDNAIRFQEIMAKAYTVGGASPTEASTSMYQLVQALGSGTLAGDELRSVREGAPLAYKAIEKFAQGVYDTDESLKQLASDGKISAEIVTAAIMDAEFSEKIDKQFEKTKKTFGQTWDSIKNMATKAFEPALQALNDALKNPAVQRGIEMLGVGLCAIGNLLGWVFGLFGSFFNWCADNWNWLKYIVVGVLVVIAAYIVKLTAVTLINAAIQIASWIAVHWQIALIILIIVAAIAAILWLAEATGGGCKFMVGALLVVAAALLLIGIIIGNVALIIIAIVIALAAVFLAFAEEIVGGIYWIGAVFANVGLGIANFCVALFNSIKAICINIGVAFNNAWHKGESGFWDFIASCLEGLDWLAKPLSKIAELFGKSFNYEDFTASIRAKADYHDSKVKDYVSVSDAWNNGINHFEYKDLSDAYDKGARVGSNIQETVGGWGTAIANKLSGLTDADSLKNMLGVDGLPNPNDPSYDIEGAWKEPTINDLLSTVDGINDKMDVSDDDLEFLRKIAEMEWRNEFTTAEIKVDMTNNNTVNGERDLDGIVEYLADVLRDEMAVVAEGVHY